MKASPAQPSNKKTAKNSASPALPTAWEPVRRLPRFFP